MKLTLILTLLALISTGCRPQPRFQLIAAETPLLPQLPADAQTGPYGRVYRIDTHTGQTWSIGIGGDGKGNISEIWIPITEPSSSRFDPDAYLLQ